MAKNYGLQSLSKKICIDKFNFKLMIWYSHLFSFVYQKGSGNLKNEMLNHHPHFKYSSCEPVERKCVNALTIWLTIKKQITEDHKTQHVKYLMQNVSLEKVYLRFLSA